MYGKFITIEGCEGVGKSTQVRLLKEYLESTSQHALFTREPGGTAISEQVRAILLNPENTAMTAMTEAYLYAASRAQLVREVIRPALERGELVVCDRFIDSSLAYQGVARGLGVDTVLEINRAALDGLVPDCTVFINLSPEHAFRSKARSQALAENDRLEREALAFHNAVYDGFLELSRREPNRFACVTPCTIKADTSALIIEALRERGLIK